MKDRIELNKIFLKDNGLFLLHLDEKSNHYGKLLLNNIFDEYVNEIIWHYFMGGKTQKGFSKKHDSILTYAKNNSFYFNDKVLESVRYLFDKPSLGSHKDIEEIKCGKCGNGQKIWKSKVKKDDVWDISGVFNMANEFYDFDTQKPESLLRNLIESFSKEGDIVLDNFGGLGTTMAVAHKLKRKWIGIEMGNHINEFYLDNNKKKIGIKGRMKQVLAGKGRNEPGGISKDVNWQGGGFFKYYELEQYEETLANCKYEDGDLFNVPGRSPYQEYVFMKDEKMLKALEIDYKNNKVKVDLSKLYPNIDIAETLSNLTGKWIKKISKNEVEFEDGTKINTKDLDYKLIKPLIWW
jgi:adenine specific DNA methylase Mod